MANVPVSRVSYSTLLREPSSVVPNLAFGDIVLERRDGEDLVLSTASRNAAVIEGIDLAVGTLRLLAHTNPDVLASGLRESLPWIAWLPPEDQAACMGELLNDLAASVDVDSFTRFHADLSAWRSTAEVCTDPQLAASLSRPRSGDAGEVERPRRG